ncbi:hypothetical protein [Prescottella subtropica]|nr:hypothetical protein [Prescottella subtropica]
MEEYFERNGTAEDIERTNAAERSGPSPEDIDWHEHPDSVYYIAPGEPDN